MIIRSLIHRYSSRTYLSRRLKTREVTISAIIIIRARRWSSFCRTQTLMTKSQIYTTSRPLPAREGSFRRKNCWYWTPWRIRESPESSIWPWTGSRRLTPTSIKVCKLALRTRSETKTRRGMAARPWARPITRSSSTHLASRSSQRPKTPFYTSI